MAGDEIVKDALKLRAARDDDAAGLIALIAGCFAEYEGCVIDLEGIDAELKAIDTAFRAVGGKFWVLEDAANGARVVASVGLCAGGTIGEGAIELKKLYVDAAYRRRGIATGLLDLVLDEAGNMQARAVELWSDTRFLEAHAFYRHHGFRRLPGTRDLNDASNSTEFHFIREL